MIDSNPSTWDNAVMKPHQRRKEFPIGRICMVCGRGQTPRLGGCAGFSPALRAAGYEWDAKTTLGFAHLSCMRKAQKAANKLTGQ